MKASARITKTFIPVASGLAAAALAAWPVFPGEDETPIPGEAEVVIVTASRIEETLEETAAAVTVITREEIERSNARTVAELLRRVPGVWIAEQGSTGHYTTIFMRGSASKNTLVLIDGIPVNAPAFGIYDFAHLTLDRIERIEVLRGPGSVVHGSNAGGGVIHIITRQGSGKAFHGDARVSVGKFETGRSSAILEGANDPFRYSLGVAYDTSDNQFDNDAYRARTFSGTLGFRIGSHSDLLLSSHRISASTEIGPQYGFDPVAFVSTEKLDVNAYQRDRQGVYSLRLLTDPAHGKRWKQTVDISYRNRRNRYADPEDSNWPEALSSRDHASEFRVSLAEHIRFSKHAAGVAGAEWCRTRGSSESPYETPSYSSSGSYRARTTTRALFAEQRWKANDFAASVAVRHERTHTRAHTVYQDSFTPFGEGDPRSRANVTTYRASLSQRFPDLAEGGKFRVVFASSFRHPSLVDLFSPGTLPNPDLRPERGKSVEMGWDQSLFGGKAALSVTVFRNHFLDLIKFSYVPAAFKFASENIGRAQMEGLEATWRQKWAAGFYSTFSYTYLDARDLDADELLIRRPRHSGFLRVGYAHHERFDVGVEALRSGTRPDDPFGGPFPDALHPYTLANAFGTVRLGHGIFIELRATNLLDENYESTGAYPSASRGKVVAANAIGFPLPRCSYTAGLRWEF